MTLSEFTRAVAGRRRMVRVSGTEHTEHWTNISAFEARTLHRAVDGRVAVHQSADPPDPRWPKVTPERYARITVLPPEAGR